MRRPLNLPSLVRNQKYYIYILKPSLLIDYTYKKITGMTSCNPDIKYKIYQDCDMLEYVWHIV